MTLILASSSPYRQRLLQRLGLPFEAVAPNVDETPIRDEKPAALALRLGQLKARAIAAAHPQAIVIGSDQVADLDGQILGKPGTHSRAREQLLACSGKVVTFHTSIAVVCSENSINIGECVEYSVEFRQLSQSAIDDYLRRDQPWDCAGSFRWESLGIALFTRMSGSDPTALEGLPLIQLTQMLEDIGVHVLAQ